MTVAGINGTMQAVTAATSGLPVIALNIRAPQNRLRHVPKTSATMEKPFHWERSSMPRPMT